MPGRPSDPLWHAVSTFGLDFVHLPPAAAAPRGADGSTEKDPGTSSVRRAMSDLAAEVGQCRACRLAETRNLLVFGEGNPDSGVVFVGEGPGQTEDETGRPFVGRAGQLLDRILASIDLDRTCCYIANAVKCRPPGNRVPLPDEMDACGWILRRQLEIIAPGVIVALGASAASALLGSRASIAQLRVGWHSKGGASLMVTYHPSAVLRTPALKRPVWEDMKKLRSRLNEIGLPRRAAGV